jgi:hypothetical protein
MFSPKKIITSIPNDIGIASSIILFPYKKSEDGTKLYYDIKIGLCDQGIKIDLIDKVFFSGIHVLGFTKASFVVDEVEHFFVGCDEWFLNILQGNTLCCPLISRKQRIETVQKQG